MPAILITGKPGQGKTHFAMKKYVSEAIKAGRQVFTNIDGCDFDVQPIPVNEQGELDWTLTPDGSLTVYDEAQRLEDLKGTRYFAWANRQKLSERAVIKEIEYHRHSAKDLIYITQSPKFLHLHLLELINEHYHCTRLRNEKRSQISLWRSWQEKPDSVAAQERAEDIFFQPFDNEIFKHYKSTEEVTDGKVRIPKHYYKLGAIALICFGLAGALLFNMTNHFSDGHRIGQGAIESATGEKQTNKTKETALAAADLKSDSKNVDLTMECRKAVNVDKPECKEWFDKLTSDKSSVTSTGQVIQAVSYNPNKPYDFEYEPQVTPTDFPRMSGVMKLFSGKLIALDQQGNYMQNVSQQDCQKWLNGYRPFDYFAQKQKSIERVSTSELKQLNPETSL